MSINPRPDNEALVVDEADLDEHPVRVVVSEKTEVLALISSENDFASFLAVFEFFFHLSPGGVEKLMGRGFWACSDVNHCQSEKDHHHQSEKDQAPIQGHETFMSFLRLSF